MRISYDLWKKQKTLEERALSFDDAPKVFAGNHYTRVDDRKDYGEMRYITTGLLDGKPVVMVWTPRGGARHIISMRRAHGKEIRKIKIHLD